MNIPKSLQLVEYSQIPRKCNAVEQNFTKLLGSIMPFQISYPVPQITKHVPGTIITHTK